MPLLECMHHVLLGCVLPRQNVRSVLCTRVLRLDRPSLFIAITMCAGGPRQAAVLSPPPPVRAPAAADGKPRTALASPPVRAAHNQQSLASSRQSVQQQLQQQQQQRQQQGQGRANTAAQPRPVLENGHGRGDLDPGLEVGVKRKRLEEEEGDSQEAEEVRRCCVFCCDQHLLT